MRYNIIGIAEKLSSFKDGKEIIEIIPFRADFDYFLSEKLFEQ